MATADIRDFLRRLTRSMGAETLGEQSDRRLVEQFLAGRNEAAFEVLVRRHGPMVYRVCWRVLQQAEEAEDAFQATFLVLAQKVRTVRKLDSVASWLHGVAHRVALKAKARTGTRDRRRQKAVSVGVLADEITWAELRRVLDSELARLPEKWRLPLILCYLEGRTQDEAAGHLGWSKNTLRRRLDEARAALRRRLSGRGVVWPATFSAMLLSDCLTSAALPARLIASTVEAAGLLAAGQAVTTSVVSTKVAALTHGVLKTMFLTKLKTAMAILLIVGTLTLGAGLLTHHTAAAQHTKAKPPQKAEAKGTTALNEGEGVKAQTEGPPARSEPTNADEKPEPVPDAAGVLSAAAIEKLFSMNAALADEKLKDKRVKVRGKVIQIRRAASSAISYVLDMASEESAVPPFRNPQTQPIHLAGGLSFQFTVQERGELAKLRPGQLVIIEGKGGDYSFTSYGTGAVTFSDCKIIKTEN